MPLGATSVGSRPNGEIFKDTRINVNLGVSLFTFNYIRYVLLKDCNPSMRKSLSSARVRLAKAACAMLGVGGAAARGRVLPGVRWIDSADTSHHPALAPVGPRHCDQ